MSDETSRKLEPEGARVPVQPPQGEIQSAVFRDAGPDDWTSDDDIATMARQGHLVVHEPGA